MIKNKYQPFSAGLLHFKNHVRNHLAAVRREIRASVFIMAMMRKVDRVNTHIPGHYSPLGRARGRIDVVLRTTSTSPGWRSRSTRGTGRL